MNAPAWVKCADGIWHHFNGWPRNTSSCLLWQKPEGTEARTRLTGAEIAAACPICARDVREDEEYAEAARCKRAGCGGVQQTLWGERN